MIEFADFEPRVIDPGGFFREQTLESFREVLAQANEWIRTEQVDVINVETVVLPNMHDEEGTEDVSLRTSGEYMSQWYSFIRVWYRV